MSSIVRTWLKEDTSGLTDELLCEVITEILSLPGVQEAVLLAAHKREYEVAEVLTGRNCPTVKCIPFAFIWDHIQADDDAMVIGPCSLEPLGTVMNKIYLPNPLPNVYYNIETDNFYDESEGNRGLSTHFYQSHIDTIREIIKKDKENNNVT